MNSVQTKGTSISQFMFTANFCLIHIVMTSGKGSHLENDNFLEFVKQTSLGYVYTTRTTVPLGHYRTDRKLQVAKAANIEPIWFLSDY